MALQSSGAISINDIVGEFGGTAPHALNEYYGVATGVPSSGEISIYNFYGTSNTIALLVTMWGAGGGHRQGTNGAWGHGGAGGFATGTYTVTPGTSFKVLVGTGGADGGNVGNPYGGVGGNYNNSGNSGGAGGGLVGIFTGTSTVGYSDTARAIIVAGSGGGAGQEGSVLDGGSGGGSTGSYGGNNAFQCGKGGTQSAVGASGTGNECNPGASSYMAGGNNCSNSGNGGGGGAGYWAGGQGAGQGYGHGGAGGGSGYIGGSGVSSASYSNNGVSRTPPQTGNSKYGASAGYGALGHGSSSYVGEGGRIVITKNGTDYVYSSGSNTTFTA